MRCNFFISWFNQKQTAIIYYYPEVLKSRLNFSKKTNEQTNGRNSSIMDDFAFIIDIYIKFSYLPHNISSQALFPSPVQVSKLSLSFYLFLQVALV